MGAVTVDAQRGCGHGHPGPVGGLDATGHERHRTGGDQIRVVDDRSGPLTGCQGTVGPVAAVGECLGHDLQAGLAGHVDHHRPRLGHQHPVPVADQRLHHRGGHVRVGAHPVVEGAVRLDVGHHPAQGPDHLVEDGALLVDVPDQPGRRHREGTPPEPLAVAVGDMGADDHPPGHGGRRGVRHHPPVAGVEATGQAGTGHLGQHGEIAGGERLPLGQVRIEVDGHHPPSIGHWRAAARAWMTAGRRGAIVSTMPQPPALTPEQRQAALAKAAKVRRERAEVKEKLKLGSITLSELLTTADANETVGKMKVLSVLESLPGLGKVKARRLMDTVGISESRRLQGLGSNQREALLRETAR